MAGATLAATTWAILFVIFVPNFFVLNSFEEGIYTWLYDIFFLSP
jgi:hypothetical protein